MARRSFGQFLRDIGHAVFPAVPQRRRAIPRPPKIRIPKPSPVPKDNAFRRIWDQMNMRGRRRNFSRNYEFFKDLPNMDRETPEDQEELWKGYLQYMVRGEGPYKRGDVRNPFWNMTGIHPSNFDWQEWRATFDRRGTP